MYGRDGPQGSIIHSLIIGCIIVCTDLHSIMGDDRLRQKDGDHKS